MELPLADQQSLSPSELSQRTVGVDATVLATQHPSLFTRWQNSELRPTAITLAFDPQARGGRGALFSSSHFVGAWVDAACGVLEPAVDRWEQGLLYPTWEQLCRLSALTQTPLDKLLNGASTNQVLLGCINDPTGFTLRHRFHPAIVATTVNAHPEQPSLDCMAKAIHLAITDIRASIEAGTDPHSIYVNVLLGE
ncbi:hypothetical protein MB46_19495 (plasmid) [Arthrobacter alpinus]|nr:hypothetical protein MB46_19495 [Arthrobacter alpinus]